MRSLDVIANSAGLTDFNPDLRDALSSNVDSAINLLEFLRKCDHAGLMHLSTCYVVGMRDGRVTEELALQLQSSEPSRLRRGEGNRLAARYGAARRGAFRKP